MEKQRTLKRTAEISGIALHTGDRAKLRIQPAAENTGILFRRIDIAGNTPIPALAPYVVDVRRGTTIANQKKEAVFTIEHIMSALHAWHVDNAVVEMDGMEPPILDGSSLPYFQMIAEAGVEEQEAEAKYYTPAGILMVRNGSTQVVIAPDDELRISCLASFKGCPVDPQYHETTVTTESYQAEIAGARTFVLYNDLQQLLQMGLVKGGSLDAAAIIHNGAIICKEKLRFPDEIVRHKILDLVGDLFLCGRRVRGNVIAIKPGHPRNVELAGRMFQEIMTQTQQPQG